MLATLKLSLIPGNEHPLRKSSLNFIIVSSIVLFVIEITLYFA